MGRKLRSKPRLGKKIRLRENRIPTYVVMNKYNNNLIGVYATQYQVYSLIEIEHILDTLVVTDITYSNKVDVIEFIIKNEKQILNSIAKEVEFNENKIARLKKAKANYVAKLRELNNKRYYVLEAIDSTIESIEEISLKIYDCTLSLDKANNQIKMLDRLIEQNTKQEVRV